MACYQKADNKHPYGHGKMEYVTSLVIGLFIMTMGISLLSAAVGSEIVETHHRFIALIVVAITIILKFALARYILKKENKSTTIF